MPESVAARSGGVQGFANEIDRELGVRGSLIVVAGPAYWVVTSYPDADAAADALRSAVNARPNDRLVDELVPAIRRIGRIDPGPGGRRPVATGARRCRTPTTSSTTSATRSSSAS